MQSRSKSTQDVVKVRQKLVPSAKNMLKHIICCWQVQLEHVPGAISLISHLSRCRSVPRVRTPESCSVLNHEELRRHL